MIRCPGRAWLGWPAHPGGRPGRHHRRHLPCLAAGLGGAFLLGTGTALVYPSLLAAVSDATHPAWRASALGVYRFWRDAGYAIGALIGGITAARASLDAAIGVAAVLTAVSGILAWAFMRETHPGPVAGGGRRVPQPGEAARRVNGGTT